MHFQFDPTRPIYLQIVGEIKKRSLRGEYEPGSKLPSVRQLSGEMGVNPNTTARAYAELERQGFIFTRRGQGSFVVEDRSRIEKERKQVVDAAAARFVLEVKELDLNEAQRKRILDRLKEDLQ